MPKPVKINQTTVILDSGEKGIVIGHNDRIAELGAFLPEMYQVRIFGTNKVVSIFPSDPCLNQ